MRHRCSERAIAVVHLLTRGLRYASMAAPTGDSAHCICTHNSDLRYIQRTNCGSRLSFAGEPAHCTKSKACSQLLVEQAAECAQRHEDRQLVVFTQALIPTFILMMLISIAQSTWFTASVIAIRGRAPANVLMESVTTDSVRGPAGSRSRQQQQQRVCVGALPTSMQASSIHMRMADGCCSRGGSG
jgi:hypothetical protein